MNIQFERRTDRPDAMGRCPIYLRVYFDGQRPRFATGEKCLASEWNEARGQFRRSFPGNQEANAYLLALADRLRACHRKLLADGVAVTTEALRAALQPALPEPKQVHHLTALYNDYLVALKARGYRTNTLRSAQTVGNHLAGFEAERGKRLLLAAYTLAVHDQFLGYLRQGQGLADNSVAKAVKHLKTFLRYVREDLGLPTAVEPRALKARWVDVDKVYLTARELELLAKAMLPDGLTATRDAFLFCCYTGIRYSDLRELSAANLREWQGGKVLRLTQTKTRSGVSIYLTAPALALLDKYSGSRKRLLPVQANQVMNRNLKRIAQLANLFEATEVVTVEQGKVVKRSTPKWQLVTMHTARHTFATQSLLRGMPVEVLQKILGHASIKTTLIYAKIVEDLQHQTMRRVWEGQSEPATSAAGTICAVVPAA